MFVIAQTRLDCDITLQLLPTLGRTMAISTTALLGFEADAIQPLRPLFANMLLGLTGTLTDQQMWNVALCMNSHERAQDPRNTGSVQCTRHDFHGTEDSMYGREVGGKVLGATGAPKAFNPSKESRP